MKAKGSLGGVKSNSQNSRNQAITEEQTTQNSSDSPQELNNLLKKLNKPEMLLLNHLQNQIKLYYPDQAKKNKLL